MTPACWRPSGVQVGMLPAAASRVLERRWHMKDRDTQWQLMRERAVEFLDAHPSRSWIYRRCSRALEDYEDRVAVLKYRNETLLKLDRHVHEIRDESRKLAEQEGSAELALLAQLSQHAILLDAVRFRRVEEELEACRKLAEQEGSAELALLAQLSQH